MAILLVLLAGAGDYRWHLSDSLEGADLKHQRPEKAFSQQFDQLVTMFGWECYTPWLSVYSPRGWPDKVICKPPRIHFVELKAGKNKPSPDQLKWLELLTDSDCDARILWPEQLEDFAEELRG